MTAPAECPPPVAGQWLVRAVLRGAVRLLFRGLVRPPMPIAGQRAVLRLLTAATLTPRGVTRTQAAIKGVPCEWLRPTRRSGNVLLYLHGGAYLPPAGDPLLHPAWLRQALELYCPRGLERRDPGVSPLFADLAELPPRLIQVGEDEVLLNDSQRLAERTRAADGAVRLERYAGLWHVFQVHAGVLKAADQALARIATFLLEHQGS